MELKLAKDIAVSLSKYKEDDRSILGNAVIILDDRITELEAVLRELLRHGEFPGTITRNNLEARRNALKVLAKGE